MSRPVWLTPAILTLYASGCVMMSVIMGLRQVQGLLIGPLSIERAWPLATFSLAAALHNLMWGMFQPFTGAAADRFGAARVAAVGSFAFGLGMLMLAFGDALTSIVGLGVVAGFGLAATSFSVVLGPVGRAVAAPYRTTALGTGSALGSLGMMGMIPLTQGLLSIMPAGQVVWVLALISFAILPVSMLLAKGERMAVADTPAIAGAGQSVGESLREALSYPGYRMLAAGFFVCGFQLAFIAVHLPGYLALCGMSPSAGATSLLVIGLFNVIGTFWAGKARLRGKYLLSLIYLGRAVVTLIFVLGPKSQASMLAYAAAMGMMWLSTVPPTSGLIAQMFGPRYLGMLFGVVFFSHQVGGFLGAWAGGLLFDATGSYDGMWIATAIAGVLASLVHLPIRDQSVKPALA